MNILGIETSCDETAAAVVVDGQRVRSNVVASQIALHQTHGGVVPELAARHHVTAIIPVVEAALAEAALDRPALDVIAVTSGPGLAGSLLVGVNVAKALAYALDRPLVTVNHLEAHIYANWLSLPGEAPPAAPVFPALCLLVSGGHTELILMTGHGRYHHLGRTLDDAAGEAFDKGARLLGLGYPGGPAIEHSAAGGDPTRFDLPRAWLGNSDDVSFSGLKTALLRLVEPYRAPTPEPASATPDANSSPFAIHQPPTFTPHAPIADLAAGFQEAIVDVLATKTARAAHVHGVKSVFLAGGVAANGALRHRLPEAVARRCGSEVPVRIPPMAYCTDNAAIVAGAACFALRRGDEAGWDADVHPRLPLVARKVTRLHLTIRDHGRQHRSGNCSVVTSRKAAIRASSIGRYGRRVRFAETRNGDAALIALPRMPCRFPPSCSVREARMKACIRCCCCRASSQSPACIVAYQSTIYRALKLANQE